jgi:hypothetical protein
MTITHTSEEQIQARLGEFHILTYAEEGFAPLNIHGEPRGISKALLVSFADEVNRKRESGSLHPRAPISAVPRVFIRNLTDSAALSAQIVDFLRANLQTIHAKRVLCDFRTPRVAPYVVSAIEDAMRSPEAEEIDEVVIMSPIV